ncbi:hypothetical protein [Roseomonas xinghualingensis]|uniref:hypothetical protein n=1 Tax=Roseomonas xinghualingensis TaxID=2986475 RepID=UPI00366AF69A|nr:hypothetical protein [Roseomonas sp. SXEYE001]
MAPLRCLALITALALTGCASDATESSWWNPIGLGPAPSSPPPATGVVLPVRAADPVAAFAARAHMGQTEAVVLPDSGRTVSARMVRTYNAASGRECREVQFGQANTPGGPPGATYCNDPAQGWIAARALLRGGAVYRP